MTTYIHYHNAINKHAIRHVQDLALSEGVSFAPFTFSPSDFSYRPSHVELGGLGARVMGRRAHPDFPQTFIFDKLADFQDIEWMVLVCLPSKVDDDPVIYRIPRAEWEGRPSITIKIEFSCMTDFEFWYTAYRWSPKTRQEVRWDIWIREEMLREMDTC